MVGILRQEQTMIYTVDELKRLIPQNEIADAARFCGMSYSSLWRIWQGRQEPREGTLKILKTYVETSYDPK
jgi:transcriptional regulator with XRE-family HTH domain